jgi:hypothetical protein
MGTDTGSQIKTHEKPVPMVWVCGCSVATPAKKGMPCPSPWANNNDNRTQQCSNNTQCTMSANAAHNGAQ